MIFWNTNLEYGLEMYVVYCTAHTVYCHILLYIQYILYLDLLYFGKDKSCRTQAFVNEVFLSFAGRCPKLAQYYDNYFDCSVQFGIWKREEGLTSRRHTWAELDEFEEEQEKEIQQRI